MSRLADAFEAMLDALNSAYAADPVAVALLCANRVQCNQTLADHPTVQVGLVPVAGVERFGVGALGLLNGVIEAATGRRIAMVWDDSPEGDGRRQFLGFAEFNSTSLKDV